MKLKSTVQRSVDLAFARFAELVKPATFKKVVGYATDPLTGLNVHVYATAEVGYLRLHFRSQDVDGVSIIYGDEKWLVKASELVTISPEPSSGDWFEVSGQKIDIRAALLDPTENLWTFHIRRTLPALTGGVFISVEDWGDLTAFTSDEGWGDLALADSSDDWNK